MLFNLLLPAFYGYMFHDNTKGAFAAFRFWEGIGLVTGYLFNSFLCVDTKIYSLLALLASGVIGYFLTEKVQRRMEKTNTLLQTSIDNVTASFINTTLHDSFSSSRHYHSPWSRHIDNYACNLPVLAEEEQSDLQVNCLNSTAVFETAV